jgi:hypothetical protein
MWMIVEATRPQLAVHPPAVTDRLLGVILGRAVAHEIGHYLPDTHTHAPTGLMRARFSAREFADLRSDAFVLDPEASAWLRARLQGAATLASAR